MPRKPNNRYACCAALALLFLMGPLLFVPVARADTPEDSLIAPPPADTTGMIDTAAAAATPVDSIILDPVLYRPAADSLLVKPYLSGNTTASPDRSPTKTMLKSVAFPGWGQFSNRKYIKAGIVFAIESYFIYRAVDYGIKAGDSRDLWKNIPDSLKDAKADAFRRYADDRDNRNSNITYTVIVAFLSMIDAYVDAHLRDFPKPMAAPDDVSLEVSPGRETKISLVYRF